MNEAEVSITLDDAPMADAVHQALQPEVAEGPEGSRVVLRRDGAVLTAAIQAPDVSTLRAALNSLLRLLDTARRVV